MANGRATMGRLSIPVLRAEYIREHPGFARDSSIQFDFLSVKSSKASPPMSKLHTYEKAPQHLEAHSASGF